MRIRFGYAAALLLCSAPAVASAQATSGSLIIVGGGSTPAALRDRFVELAGGKERANILVIPLAAANPAQAGPGSVEVYTRMGVKSAALVLTREQADSDTIERVLKGVTGVWFPGGVQTRITAALRGTRFHKALLELYRNGAVLGGTSAGAAIMSDSMLTGSQFQPGVDTAVYLEDTYTRIARRSIEIVPGLGFLNNAIVDQHFVRRERHNRLLSVTLDHPKLIGAGIDEGTALEVKPDGTWEVWGASVVVIYDARKASMSSTSDKVLGASEIRMHVLPAGGRFDPRSGKATLPK
jgi:cyanophycinase